jgi:hypothetical protein
VACDADSGPNTTSVIDADLERGMHYVVLKGDGAGQAGSYHLNIRDVDARADNRLACANAAADETLSYDVVAGQDYTVLLKGDARSQQGPFNIKLYDELGLQSGGGQLVTCKTICPNIPPYNCKGVGVLASSNAECCSGTRQLGRCSTSGTSSCLGSAQACSTDGQCCSGTCVRPLGALLGAGTCSNAQCAQSELTNNFTQTLSYDTHYMTVKGRKANEKGFYEVQVGDSAQGGGQTTYVPPTWTEVADALENTGAKVLPVVSCPTTTGVDSRSATAKTAACNGTLAQARALSKQTGAIDTDPNSPTLNQGITAQIEADGSGIGASLAESVRDLASYLAMDITVSVANNPGFTIAIQKCTNIGFPEQAACSSVSTGCDDTSAVPKNTVKSCRPGAVPKFLVSFTNPAGPSPPPVPPNDPTLDPNGGYHFKLQIVGDHQYLLDEVPVYIIPTGNMGPPPPAPGGGTYVMSGSYEQQVFGAGCGYFNTEGESANPRGEAGSVANCRDGDDNDGDGTVDMRDRDCDSCRDGLDNDGDGLTDRGIDLNGDGDFADSGESAPESGCFAGSCDDNDDNDNDNEEDLEDPDCASTEIQDWSDLYFNADVPPGTSISFDVCTADNPMELATCGSPMRSFSRVATITSAAVPCANDSDCGNVMVGSVTRDGFCGAGGQCQFITPQKKTEMGSCNTTSQCAAHNGFYNGEEIHSFCDTAQRCVYTTPPADIGNNLRPGENGKPYAKLRINLESDNARDQSPTLYDWYMTYYCRPQN